MLNLSKNINRLQFYYIFILIIMQYLINKRKIHEKIVTTTTSHVFLLITIHLQLKEYIIVDAQIFRT